MPELQKSCPLHLFLRCLEPCLHLEEIDTYNSINTNNHDGLKDNLRYYIFITSTYFNTTRIMLRYAMCRRT